MAMLEAFVYDPLINWRLMQTDTETKPPDCTFSVTSAGEFLAATLYYAAELRSQEPTRVTAYPQGSLHKLKAGGDDIFNGREIGLGVCAADDSPLCFWRPKRRGTNISLRYITGCRIRSWITRGCLLHCWCRSFGLVFLRVTDLLVSQT